MRTEDPRPEPVPADPTQFVSAASLRVRSDWFVLIRWGAAAGVVVLAALVDRVARVPLPIGPILATAAALLGLNMAYALRNRRTPPTVMADELRVVKLQMAVDLLLLTVLVHLTGGLENPFHFIYVIHVLIASLLFRGRDVAQVALLAGLLFSAVALGEHFGGLTHHHLEGAGTLTHGLLYVGVSLVSFWLVLFGAAWVGASIMRHNRAIKDELVTRSRELEAADQAKLDFFRYVSHEVKTPVATAQSAVEAVLGVSGADLSEKAAETLRRAVARLSQALEIVKDLTDLTRTKLDAGRDVGEVDLNRLVERALGAQAERIAARRLQAEADLPEPPATLRANETLVEKIVDNLVSNAVRYNREGGALRVRVRDLGDRVELCVADEGIGIASQDRTRVFEEFFRTPEAKAASHEGTGLGLPIVKRFTAQLGGALDLDSRPGEGTTFTVTLPAS